MPFRLKEDDCKTLECIAEYRMLTVTQIAAILHKSRQVVRRRLSDLEKEGLIEVIGREFGRGRGRPENSLGLSELGVDVLKDKGLFNQDVPYEKVCADCLFCTDHQLLLNWFRIHLNQVEKVVPRVSVKLFAHNSPFLPKDRNGHILTADYSPVPGSGIQGIKFTPDAVFGIRDSVADKTCLFFLEVDFGTETMVSPKRDTTDIRQKIINYQWYFQSRGYRRYEEVFKCQLHGFRLLFLTSTRGRLVALCELIQQIRPSNFVWLTECSSLFLDGVSAEIWARGGDLHGPPRSILGSLCCRAPLP
jgi:DNA-binding transcriptional ArsR family regulator